MKHCQFKNFDPNYFNYHKTLKVIIGLITVICFSTDCSTHIQNTAQYYCLNLDLPKCSTPIALAKNAECFCIQDNLDAHYYSLCSDLGAALLSLLGEAAGSPTEPGICTRHQGICILLLEYVLCWKIKDSSRR